MQTRLAFYWLVAIQVTSALCSLSAWSQEPGAASVNARTNPNVNGTRLAEAGPLPAASSKSPAIAELDPPGQDLSPVSGSDLLIQSGDLLAISLYGVPEFSRETRVSESGYVSLPLIGDVRVAELTIHDAEMLIRKALVDGSFFNDPQLSIVARESASRGTSVLGEVQKPGIYYLPGQRTLFDALSAAGGTTAKAGNTITITHRGRLKDPQTVTLPPNETLPPASNVPVSPGDTIVVSKAGIVYVVGDVRLPGGFVMENANLTVLQAVALAQGANATAKLDSTILIRRHADGRQEIPVLLSKVMEAKSPDPMLMADDVIFVPRSNAKAGFRRGLEAALQTVVGMAIYRPL